MSSRTFDYDFALSFAGEKRSVAKKLAREIRRRAPSARVFLDSAEQAALWGKNDRDLTEVYEHRSRYVVPLISAAYAESDWTRLEYSAGLNAHKSRGDVLVPLRFDDTTFLGLQKNVIHADMRQVTLAQVADGLVSRLGSNRRRSQRTATQRNRDVLLKWMAPERLKPLSLLAAIGLVFEPLLEAFFPRIPWRRYLPEMSRAGLIRRANHVIQVETGVERALLSDPTEAKRWTGEWLKVLRPRRLYPDVALSYAQVALRMGKLEEALETLSAVAPSVIEPNTLKLYIATLDEFLRRAPLPSITPTAEMRARNALGICLTETADFSGAIREFQRLRSLAFSVSESTESQWAIGQSLINEGVARARMGLGLSARVLYEAAALQSQKHADRRLRGRALGNLAFMSLHDTQRARSLLAESIVIKREIRDRDGLFASHFAGGLLAGMSNDWRSAAGAFRKAEASARRRADARGEAAAMVRRAVAQANLGRRSLALQTIGSARARVTGEDHESQDVRALADETEAEIRLIAGEHARAAAIMLRASRVRAQLGEESESLRDGLSAGAALKAAGQRRRAHQVLRDIAAAAAAAEQYETAAVALIEQAQLQPKRARPFLERASMLALRAGDTDLLVRVLVRRVEYEAAEGRYAIAARILQEVERRVADPGKRLAAMRDRMRIQFALGRRLSALRIFHRIRREAQEADLPEHFVAAHLEVGDELLASPKLEDQKSACRAYTAALVFAFSVGEAAKPEVWLRCGGHVALRLRQRGLADEQLELLSRSLLRWRELEGPVVAVPKLRQFILWPFSLARRLRELQEQGRFTASRITEAMKEVVAEALGVSRVE